MGQQSPHWGPQYHPVETLGRGWRENGERYTYTCCLHLLPVPWKAVDCAVGLFTSSTGVAPCLHNSLIHHQLTALQHAHFLAAINTSSATSLFLRGGPEIICPLRKNQYYDGRQTPIHHTCAQNLQQRTSQSHHHHHPHADCSGSQRE